MPNQGPWNYILVFNDSIGTISQVKNYLDKQPEILSWYYCMTHAIFIRSELTAKELTDLFREFSHSRGRFIILDCNTDRNGWLPKKAWEFMRNEYP